MQIRLASRVRAINIWLMAPLLGLAVFLSVFAVMMAPVATAATSNNLNFQARLMGSNGTIVPDGTYNIDFKLYNADSTTGTVGTCSGSCLWEETRKNSNSQGVQVINGYFSVNLGSVTPFASTINWDQPLWLTMNIGGTTTGASPSWDGEMQNAGHSIALTALPYSFIAGQLAKTDGSGNRGTLGFNTVANNPNILLPDASGTVCLQSAAACGFELTTGTDFIRNQATLQTANFNIDGTGIIGTALQTGLVKTADSNTSNTNGITLRSGNQTGSSLTSGNVTIQSGDANGGTNSSSGNIIVDAGAKSGSGTTGTITIGGTNASGITIGNITNTNTATLDASNINLGNSSSAHTVNIGHGGTSGQIVNIGSTSSSSAVTISAGSGNIGLTGNTSVQGTLTVAPATNIGSAVIKQTSAASPTADIFNVQGSNGTSNFIQVTSTAANQGAVSIQSFGSNNITFQSGSGTVSLGTSTTLNASGALTVASGGSSDLTLDSASSSLKFGTNTTILQKVGNALALDVSNGASNSSLNISNSGGAGNITLKLDSGGSFAVGASTGTTAAACGSGQAITGTLVGGIVTGGSCIGSVSTLQQAYDNSTSPATITTSSATKGLVLAAGSGFDNIALFQVQNSAGSDVINVNSADGYFINNGTEDLGNELVNPGFEAGGTTDASGWFTPSATQVITTDSANAHGGNRELQITANSSTHAVTTKYYAVHPGDTIYVEAYVKNSAGATGDGGIYIEVSDKDKGNASFTTMDTGLPGTSYTLKSNTLTIPSGKYFVRLAASVRATATAGTFYFDDFYLKRVNQQAALLLSGPSATAFQVQNASAQTILGVDSSNSRIFTTIPDGASAVGFTFNTPSYTTAGAKLLSLQNNLVAKFSVDKDGNVTAAGGVSASGNITTTENVNIGSGKQYQINGTQVTSAILSNDNNLAKLDGSGPQTFSGNNKFTGTVLVQNANAAGFQVQNATNSIFTVDTSGNKVILGAASAVTGSIQFQGSGGAGTLTLVGPTTPNAGNFTLSIPAITANANICTDNSICSGYASSSSLTSGLNSKLNKGAVDTSGASVTAVQGNLYAFTNNSNNIASGVLKLDNGNNSGNALTITGSFNYGVGNATVVINNTNATPSGTMLDIQANGASKFNVDAAGNVAAAGNISIASGKQYQINGVQISTSALSDGSSIAKLGANQTFSGNNTFSSASNSFTGDGSGLTNLNAGNVASGTLNDGRLSSNVALLNRTGQTFSGDNVFAPTAANAGTVIRQTSSATASSGSVLDIQTADTTGHFLQITNAAANEGNVTLQSVGATRDLTLGSGSGTLKISAATNTIQHNNSSLTIDLNNGSTSTLFVTNSQSGIAANLDVEGGLNIGAGQLYKVGGTQIDSTALSNNSDLAKRGSSNTFTATNTISVTSSQAFQVQTGGSLAVLVVDTSAKQLKVMDSGGSSESVLIYYSSGTANFTATSGTVAVGTGAGAINVTAGSSSAVSITANAASTWKTTAGTLTLQSGTGTSDYLILNAGGSGQVQINGSSTIKLGSASSDPTCTNGAVYYNTSSSTFRGCQGGVWATLGTIAPTLQSVYAASTGGTTPEIKVASTQGGLDIQDMDSGGPTGILFAVRMSNVGGLGTSIFNVNDSNNTVNIGSSSAHASNAIVLVLDNYANSGADPSGINGAMYYNGTNNKFRCYENGSWHDCSDGFNEISKTADQTASLNSATLQNDNTLLFAMAANTNYVFDMWVPMDVPNASALAKYGFTVPAGATIGVIGSSVASSNGVTNCSITASAGSCAISLSTSANMIQIRGFVRNGASAGNLQFQFSQNTANATAGTAPTVKAGAVLNWRTAN